MSLDVTAAPLPFFSETHAATVSAAAGDDPDEILRIGKQSLKISPKQCAVAVQQLIEDGEL